MTSANERVVLRRLEGPLVLGNLVDTSRREGFDFVSRLDREYRDGSNDFTAAGEAFLVATIDERCVGCCGLNRDPYLAQSERGDAVARLRHL